MLIYFSEDFDSRMNVDGACDGSDDSEDEEDGISVKEEPIEEGDFDLGIVPVDAELEDMDEETLEACEAIEAGPASTSVRRDPMQR